MTGSRRLLLATGGCLVLAVSIAAILAVQARRERHAGALAVVLRDGVFLRKGNGPLYEKRDAAPLNRGVEVRYRLGRHGWVQIELAGGEVGWVPRSALKIDEF